MSIDREEQLAHVMNQGRKARRTLPGIEMP
jgi:hypothetical protein